MAEITNINPQDILAAGPDNPLVQVKRIKQLSFYIDESALIPGETASEVKLEYQSGYNLDNNLMNFTLRITYLYPQNNRVFLRSEIQNVFEIRDLRQFLGENNVLKMPADSLLSVSSMSIAHSRAILALNVAGTVYNDTLLPLMDGIKVAKQFFGDAIEEMLKPRQVEKE